MPFCTSGGSGITNSVNNIKGLAPSATWLDGRVCNGSNGNTSALTSWANGLGLDFSPRSDDEQPSPAPVDPAPTHEHAWGNTWANDTTHHWHECDNADCTVTANADKNGYAQHTWNSGVETTAPAVETEGVKTYTCSVCSATKTEPIDKLPQPEPDNAPKVLVAYFSCTNNTENIANHIVTAVGADNATLFEIIPETPYTSADLNYSNSSCRANQEQNDASARPAIASTCKVENMADYDVIFLGYPIWWGTAPKIIYTFLEQTDYNFSGKTIIPFCTSASSGYNDSSIKALVGSDTTWVTGRRFSGSASQDTVQSWVNGLNLDLSR